MRRPCWSVDERGARDTCASHTRQGLTSSRRQESLLSKISRFRIPLSSHIYCQTRCFVQESDVEKATDSVISPEQCQSWFAVDACQLCARRWWKVKSSSVLTDHLLHRGSCRALEFDLFDLETHVTSFSVDSRDGCLSIRRQYSRYKAHHFTSGPER